MIIKPIPYWVLKILVDNENLIVENQYYKFKNLELEKFELKVTDNESIEATSIKSNKNLADEEDGLYDIEKNINNLLKIIDTYGKRYMTFTKYKIVALKLEQNPEVNKIIDDLEEVEKRHMGWAYRS